MSSTPDRTLPFADARGCKDWLGVLPLTNIPQAQSQVLETLGALNESDIAPMERVKSLELMREKIAFLQGEQRARYFGKTLPLSANDNSAWTTGRSLLEGMEAGYRKAFEAAAINRDGLGEHAALIAQRIARYVGAQMLFHAIVFRRFDPQLWSKLHQLYADAQSKGSAEEAVKDSLEGEEGVTSLERTYVQAVLMQAAFLSEMSAPQVDFAEALVRLWGRKVRVLPASPESESRIDALVVDLAKPIGARPQPRQPLEATQRVLETASLSRSMRGRIHGLQTGEDHATLGLPPQAAAVDAEAELKRLHKLWCEGAPPRPATKPSTQPAAGLVFGMPEIHFFLAQGKLFEQPDKKRELTAAEKQDIEVFGRVREQTQSRMVQQVNYSVESWPIVDEMLGAVRVQRPNTASRGVGIGRVAAVRMGDTAPFYLAAVSELVQETDGRIIATLTLFPGKPEPIAIRAGDLRNRATAQWIQGVRLPPLEKINVPATLVVPSPLGARGRGIEVWEGAAKERTVEELLQRGTDFDRVTVF